MERLVSAQHPAVDKTLKKSGWKSSILARQVNFGSYPILPKQCDEDVGVSASSSLISGDGHHFINWGNSQFRRWMHF